MENKTVAQLKEILKKYDLVAGIYKMDRDSLIKTIRHIEKYKNNKQVDYTKFSFGDKVIVLNDEQHKIVTSDPKHNMRILSCAGSGKTTTIICRIKYLVDNGVDPETIMLTTFNVDAAEVMKNKIVELFGFMPKITIGTLDSIACRFYHKYFKQSFNVGISEYATYFLKYLEANDSFILSIYKYIFFDEFQDVNETQFKILKLFHNNGTTITVIGDDAQNIYSFRGSNIKYILNLEQHVKNLKTCKLVNNYRSTPEIIGLANDSIKFNTEQIPKNMMPNNKSINFIPEVKYYSNTKAQNDEIIKKLLEFKSKNINYDQMAILSRKNYQLKIFEEAIEKFNSRTSNKINYVALINDDNGDTKPKIKKNHITLTSIHKAKGLEFEVVFVLDCNDTNFPSEVDKLSMQEERRLFYVAVTRAKNFLYFTFANDGKNKPIKLSRFVQEVDIKLYNFINHDEIFYSFDNNRTIKWTTGVMDILKNINEQDIEKLRGLEILPNHDPSVKKIHSKHDIDTFISTYYLQPDFGEFVDRYITRSIGERNYKSNGLVDTPAIIIVSASQFSNEEQLIYKKYENNFCLNTKKINSETPEWKYCVYLEENDMRLENIRKIESSDKNKINSIMTKILIMSKKFNIDTRILSQCFASKSSIPEKTRDMFMESYKKYNDANYTSGEIIQDVYNVSLCGTILNGRRRLLYKNVCDKFQNLSLFKDVNKYVSALDPEFSNLQCKKFIKSVEYDIMGEIDLLDITSGKIIDYKCSSSTQFKLEWILQLMAYLAILKKEYPDINIKEVEVYNPLQGEIYTLDMSGWTKENEYLLFLYEIRARQVTRNIIVDNLDLSLDFPFEYSKDMSNDEYIIVEKNNVISIENANFDDIVQYNIFDLGAMFGEMAGIILNHMNTHFANDHPYHPTILKFNEQNNFKYVVLDTETTGIPTKNSTGGLDSYDKLKSYDGARMIQICWALCEGNKIIELENYIIKSDGFKITNFNIHGITDKIASGGTDLNIVLDKFKIVLEKCKYIVGHNINFDNNIIMSELYRKKLFDSISLYKSKIKICTMKSSVFLKVNGSLSPPSLINLYKFLFGKPFKNQHNAKYDVLATVDVCRELIKKGLIISIPIKFTQNVENLKNASG